MTRKNEDLVIEIIPRMKRRLQFLKGETRRVLHDIGADEVSVEELQKGPQTMVKPEISLRSAGTAECQRPEAREDFNLQIIWEHLLIANKCLGFYCKITVIKNVGKWSF